MSHTYWQDALLGKFGPVHENDPQSGYYRMRWRRGGEWIPVAIWRQDDGEVLALCGAELKDPFEVWTWCCRYPVEYGVYRAVAEDGEPWPEDLPATGSGMAAETEALVKAPTSSLAVSPPPSIGHNSAGVSEAEGLLEEIEALSSLASSWLDETGPVCSQSNADRAANYAERFGSLEAKAEALRTSAKRPVLEAGRKIDAEWRPVIAKASDGKSQMKKALEPFLVAERERLKAETTIGSAEAPRAGTHGRRIGLRTKKVLSIIDDTAFVSGFKNNEHFWGDDAVRSNMVRMAEVDLLAGLTVPGAILIEQVSAA